MKKVVPLLICFWLIMALAGCGKGKDSEETHSFQATIVEIKDGTMLVTPNDGYSEAEYAKEISVVIQNMPSSPEPQVGDTIEIVYNGIMTEEDPPAPCGVTQIKVVE